MDLILDPLASTNLILALTVVVFGTLAYRASKDKTTLYLAAGFCLFAITDLLTIFGIGTRFDALHIITLISGYIAVVAALYLLWQKKPEPKRSFIKRLFSRK
ncbi:MAG: hypothetical protein WDZ82_01740 [Candidatus Paceibacterota bacterium]